MASSDPALPWLGRTRPSWGRVCWNDPEHAPSSRRRAFSRTLCRWGRARRWPYPRSTTASISSTSPISSSSVGTGWRLFRTPTSSLLAAERSGRDRSCWRSCCATQRRRPSAGASATLEPPRRSLGLRGVGGRVRAAEPVGRSRRHRQPHQAEPMMAIVCLAPQARSHSGFQVEGGRLPVSACVRAPKGHSHASLREGRLAVPRRSRRPQWPKWRSTSRDNVRSIVDSGLIPGGPHGNRDAVHICPTTPWHTSNKGNFLQHATSFISLDPVVLPDKVPLAPSPSGHILEDHHLHGHILPSVVAPTVVRHFPHHNVPMRASLGECWATTCVVDCFARTEASHRPRPWRPGSWGVRSAASPPRKPASVSTPLASFLLCFQEFVRHGQAHEERPEGVSPHQEVGRVPGDPGARRMAT